MPVGVSERSPTPNGNRPPDPENVRRTVDLITADALFSASDRLCRFLRYVVDETLAGRQEWIKEYTIGVEVYGRSAEFDPKADAIVRVEAGRLRAKLTRYYSGSGTGTPVRIELPRGTYVPVIKDGSVPVIKDGSVPVIKDASSSVAMETVRTGAALSVAAVLLVFASCLMWLYQRQPPAEGAQLRIAVLPFTTVSRDADTARFATGLVDVLTSALASEDAFLVAGRSGSDAKTPKVRAVVQGSVERTGDRIRVTAELVDSRDGYHIWSQTYESLPDRASDFQDRVSNLIVRTLRARYGGLPENQIGIPPSGDAEAVRLYLKGHEAWLTQRKGGLEDSIGLFQNALSRDSTFAKAYEGLADSELFLGDIDPGNSSAHVARAKSAALKALQLDDRLEDAHATLGNIYFRREWHFVEGEQHLRRAIALQPGMPAVTRWYSLVARLRDHYSEARQELEFGLMTNPTSEVMLTELGLLDYEERQFEAARREAELSVAADANFAPTRLLRGLLHQTAGGTEAAESEFRSCSGMTAFRRYCLAALGNALAVAGRRADALDIARELERAQPPSYRLAAVVYAGLGDRERALAALGEGYRVHDLELPFIRLDARFRMLRSEPRFLAVLENMGLDPPRQN